MRLLRVRQLIFISQIFFSSKNVDVSLRTTISNDLGVALVLGSGKYLELHSMIGRNKIKKTTFKYIKDRVWKKLNSLSGSSYHQQGVRFSSNHFYNQFQHIV